MKNSQCGHSPSQSSVSTGQSLFRQQVVENQLSKAYGTVVLTRVFSHTMLVGLFALLAISIVAFFLFFGTTRKVKCQGVLMPTAGIIRLVSVQSAVVKEVRAKEGQPVSEGDILFVLNSERAGSTPSTAEKTISALLHERRKSFEFEMKNSEAQARHRHAAAVRHTESLSMEVGRITGQLALQRKRVSLIEQSRHAGS